MRLLFQRWSFTPEDAERTSIALAIYAPGLLSFAGVKVAVSGFYAQQNTKTPVIISSCSMLLNILLNCVLVRPLGYQGLALATTISFTRQLRPALWCFSATALGTLWDFQFGSVLLRIAVATAVMAAVAYAAYVRTVALFSADTFLAQLTYTVVPIILAALVYAGVCRIFAIEELDHFLALLRRRRGGEAGERGVGTREEPGKTLFEKRVLPRTPFQKASVDATGRVCYDSKERWLL